MTPKQTVCMLIIISGLIIIIKMRDVNGTSSHLLRYSKYVQTPIVLTQSQVSHPTRSPEIAIGNFWDNSHQIPKLSTH